MAAKSARCWLSSNWQGALIQVYICSVWLDLTWLDRNCIRSLKETGSCLAFSCSSFKSLCFTVFRFFVTSTGIRTTRIKVYLIIVNNVKFFICLNAYNHCCPTMNAISLGIHTSDVLWCQIDLHRWLQCKNVARKLAGLATLESEFEICLTTIFVDFRPIIYVRLYATMQWGKCTSELLGITTGRRRSNNHDLETSDNKQPQNALTDSIWQATERKRFAIYDQNDRRIWMTDV